MVQLVVGCGPTSTVPASSDVSTITMMPLRPTPALTPAVLSYWCFAYHFLQREASTN